MKNIGFIGIGNMASMIIGGLNKNDIPTKLGIKLFGYDHHSENKLDDLNKKNFIKKTINFQELVGEVDYLFLCIKPKDVSLVTQEIKPFLRTEQVIISLVGGFEIKDLESLLSSKQKIVRIMPNINAQINESTTAICVNSSVNQEEINFSKQLLQAFGSVYEINEDQFELFSAISGSAPAIVYLFIDSLANSALEQGMNKKLATDIITCMVFGSAKMAQSSNESLRTLIDFVCSPGGTTIKAMASLEENTFSYTLNEAIKAMLKKVK